MSASESSMRGGQPSTTTPTPPPWDSPQVVIRNRCPKVFATRQFAGKTPAGQTSAGLKSRKRAQKLFGDRRLAGGIDDLLAEYFGNVERVNGGAFFGRNFGERNIQAEFGEHSRDGEEQSEAIFGFDVDDGRRRGSVVVKIDFRRDALTFERVIGGAREFAAADQ